MKRLSRVAMVVVCLSFVALGGLVGSSSAPAGAVDVRVDGYAFEPGSGVALELTPANGAACFSSNVLVEQVELADALGNTITVVPYDKAESAGDWLGIVMLRAGDGSDLPPGAYEIRVVTSEGTFTAGLSVVSRADFASLGRFVAGVPACNMELRVYRVLTELDQGGSVTLRMGDRLMVLLSGNPTTGYSWSDALASDTAPVRPSQDVEYRASSSLIGSGGFFLFRYWAVDQGTQSFRFEYKRSWESVEPISTLSFSTDVR